MNGDGNRWDWDDQLGRWCEAGHSTDAFWQATPRIILVAIRAHWRQRGWMAWHVAKLMRMDPLPELDVLTGEPLRRSVATPEQMAEAVRLWRAAKPFRRDVPAQTKNAQET